MVAESPEVTLSPYAPEFHLDTSQNVSDLSLKWHVSNEQEVEINPVDLLRDEPVESQSEDDCETEVQQDDLSLERCCCICTA